MTPGEKAYWLAVKKGMSKNEAIELICSANGGKDDA